MADKEISDLTAASTLGGTELVHVEQSGNSRKTTIADILASRIGIPFKIRAATPPDGAFAEDGSVITVATYTEFVAKAYCGDGENATADYHYRCTDSGDPANTRSTSGAFFVLCDSRGEGIRGWDDGRGVDAGRSLWEMQLDQGHGHHHQAYSWKGTGNAGAGSSAYEVWATNQTWSDPATNGSGQTISREAISDGVNGTPRMGAETRGRGSAALACIWYE